jgi:glycosyltransferase involved in cell wall biosynthesis
MQRKTVVLVCMVDSIHVARWIAQFDPTEVKFILFPSGPNRRVHSKILEMVAKGRKFDNQVSIVPFGGKLSLLLWALDRFFGDRIRGLLLGRILKKTLPDFVHALEFQHAGYVTMRALSDKSITTPFIATNYGSDIYWFQRFPRHARKIDRLLKRADFYSCECDRDVSLAKLRGFSGNVLPVMPNSGGIDLASLPTPKPFEQRRVIAVKGYDGWVGRASWALRALESLDREIRDFEVVVFSADRKISRLARKIKRRSGLRLKVHKKGFLSHEQMMHLFAESRIYIGVSLSDGLSTSMLEAIVNGCFAVQTSTACTDQVLEDGLNGIVIDDLSPEAVSSALRRAILTTYSADTINGSFHNRSQKILSKYSSSTISELARKSFYV